MNAEIQTFDFNATSLRTLTDNTGEPWFSGQDVCNILGTGTNHLREYLDEDEITNVRSTDIAQNGGKAPVFISEPGLYKLIMRSRKPEAHEFQRWVTHEVLPTIRKHGAYMTQQTINKALTSPDFLIQLATKLKEEQEKVKALEPKAKALDDFTNVEDRLLVRDAAKILSNAGTPISENQLREWMTANDWIYKSNGSWHATAKHCTAGHLVMVMSTKHGTKADGTKFAFPPTVRITRKGLSLLHQRLGETRLNETFENTLH
jgi:anti-repressor protein|nr:MAG TPA: repressor domain protein [Caudoviricetes sp.]